MERKEFNLSEKIGHAVGIGSYISPFWIQEFIKRLKDGICPVDCEGCPNCRFIDKLAGDKLNGK